jgi:hypothetical protein
MPQVVWGTAILANVRQLLEDFSINCRRLQNRYVRRTDGTPPPHRCRPWPFRQVLSSADVVSRR